MPIKWLDKPRNKNDFENLRDSLGVSNQALIYRLDETGIISKSAIKKNIKGQRCVRTPGDQKPGKYPGFLVISINLCH